MIQLSHPYMTTAKTIALTRWSFVSKVMSLLFNMLSRLVSVFLPASLTGSFLPISSSGPSVPLPQALPLFSPQNLLSSFPLRILMSHFFSPPSRSSQQRTPVLKEPVSSLCAPCALQSVSWWGGWSAHCICSHASSP